MRKTGIYVRMAPRVTIEQRQQIVVLRASGCSIKEIGKRTGITRATINLWLRRNEETNGDLSSRQRQNYKRKTTAEQDAAILVAHYNRPLLSTRDTATEHKVSSQTIRRRLKAVGLKTKKAKKKETPPAHEPAHMPPHVHGHPQQLPLVPFQADFASANFVPGLPYPATYPPPTDGYNAIKPNAPPAKKAPPKRPPAKKAPPKRPPAKKPGQSGFSNMLCVASDVDPSEVRLAEMLTGPERDRWKHAMLTELQSYGERDVWEPVPRDSDRYRARLLLLRVALKSLA